MRKGFHPSWLCVSVGRRAARITDLAVASLVPPLVEPYHRLLYRDRHNGLTGKTLRALIGGLSRLRRWLEWHSAPPVEIEEMTTDGVNALLDAEEAEIEEALARERRWRMTRMGAVALPALYFGSYFLAGVAVQVWRAFG